MVSEPEVLAAPTAEPVTLDDVKPYRRVDSADEDVLLNSMIVAARERVEEFTRLALINRTVRFTFQGFGRGLQIPAWPVVSIEAVRYVAPDGSEQVLPTDHYTLTRTKPRWIVPAYGLTWPAIRPHWNAVSVDVVVGHGDAPAAVPQVFRTAIQLIVGTLDEQRETFMAGRSVTDMPGIAKVEAMLMPHVFWAVS